MEMVKENVQTKLYAVDFDGGRVPAIIVRPALDEVVPIAYLVAPGERLERILHSYSSHEELPDPDKLPQVQIPGYDLTAPLLPDEYTGSTGVRIITDYYKREFLQKGIDLYQTE